MGLNDVSGGERLHIGFFGIRNAGKSSIVNKLTNQQVSLVSSHKGTTTDPVKKTMELLPIGPVVIIDTAGFDDEGDLGELRKKRSYRILDEIDVVVLVVDARNSSLTEEEVDFVNILKGRKQPHVIVENHIDEAAAHTFSEIVDEKLVYTDATSDDMTEVKQAIIDVMPDKKQVVPVSDLIPEKSSVILVIPIDESAPKGRIILPQQLILRDLLDHRCKAICCQPSELSEAIDENKNVSLVITDSQAFETVSKMVPKDIKLTSFSILMARYRGALKTQLKGVAALKNLENGDKILVAEACTHHRQCNDIGTVKIPGWVKKYTGKDVDFEFSSGNEFPEDLSKYKLVIHCGGCMVNDTEMKNRVKHCKMQNIPVVNYGMAIAEFNGILDRSLEILN